MQAAAWVPVGYLGAVTLAGLIPPRRGQTSQESRFVVLVAAHNEEDCVADTVHSLRSARYASTRRRIIVIAHNCTDETAQRAAAAGAEVWVRDEPADFGKGAALGWAIEALLELDDWDALAVVDADTRVDAGFLEALGGALASGAVAVQGERRVANARSSVVAHLATASMAANSALRPRGRDRLGGSAKLLGNGMAFDRATLERVRFNRHHLVEDVDYWFRLMEVGIVVAFRSDATFYDLMPVGLPAARRQRGRWQQGRAALVREWRTKGIVEAVRCQDLRQLEATVSELVFPPLAATVGLIAVPAVVLRAVGGGSNGPVVAQSTMLAGHVVAGLIVVRAGWRTWAALLLAPGAICWKALVKVMVSRPGRSTSWEPTRIAAS
jgi:hypothetical protein